MIRAAYWTCALLALAHARVYERCELARELRSLGVDPEDLSTWVCITFHESRFDTGARNGWSGDHGLFQISELYWCGPGKACGLSCEALRDDHISDDLECALKIRKEHDRLQGDGFLAWVVYPQHCKHNTKKYIVDCDIQVKNATVRSPARSRSFSNPYVRNATFEYNPNIDDLKPPYLTVNSIVRGGFAKMLENKNSAPINWLNYKIDNIDELTIPVSNKQFDSFPRFTPRTTTAAPKTTTAPTTTTARVTYPPIKVWRRIETNQFRKKASVDKKPTPSKWLELGKPASHVDFVTSYTSEDISSKSTTPTTTVKPSTTKPTTASTTVTTPQTTKDVASVTTPATFKPMTRWDAFTSTTSATFKPSRRSDVFSFIRSETTKPTTRASTFTFTTPATIKTTTVSQFSLTTATAKPTTRKATTASIFTTREYTPYTFTTPKPITSAAERQTTERPTAKTSGTTRRHGFSFGTGTTRATVRNITDTQDAFKAFSFGSTPKPKNSFNFFQTTAAPVATTENKLRTTFNFFPSTTTTKRPTTFNFFSSTAVTPKPSTLSSTLQTLQLDNTTPSPFKFSRSSRTSRLLPQTAASTNQSSEEPFARRPVTTQRAVTSPTPFRSEPTERSTVRTSQSIFDLYLSPTRWPKLPTRKFPELNNSAFRLKIFSGGTTPDPRETRRQTFHS